MIPKFELIDPDKLDKGYVLLKKMDDPIFKDDELFFIKKEKHLIIYSREFFTNLKTKITELLADQIEIPLPAIRWIIDTIEIKFFKPPGQGGLPAEQFHWCEIIEGEELCIMRAFDPTGEGLPGYDLVNLNRYGYISDTSNQEFSFFDNFLFEHGLMNFLKEIAGKYERGEL
jgi:hypothetical protein